MGNMHELSCSRHSLRKGFDGKRRLPLIDLTNTIEGRVNHGSVNSGDIPDTDKLVNELRRYEGMKNTSRRPGRHSY